MIQSNWYQRYAGFFRIQDVVQWADEGGRQNRLSWKKVGPHGEPFP